MVIDLHSKDGVTVTAAINDSRKKKPGSDTQTGHQFQAWFDFAHDKNRNVEYHPIYNFRCFFCNKNYRK